MAISISDEQAMRYALLHIIPPDGHKDIKKFVDSLKAEPKNGSLESPLEAAFHENFQRMAKDKLNSSDKDPIGFHRILAAVKAIHDAYKEGKINVDFRTLLYEELGSAGMAKKEADKQHLASVTPGAAVREDHHSAMLGPKKRRVELIYDGNGGLVEEENGREAKEIGRGGAGPPVLDIQTILKYLGGYDLGDTGPNRDGLDLRYGRKMYAAIGKFQEAHPGLGLKATGIADERTRARLFDAFWDKWNTDHPDWQLSLGADITDPEVQDALNVARGNPPPVKKISRDVPPPDSALSLDTQAPAGSPSGPKRMPGAEPRSESASPPDGEPFPPPLVYPISPANALPPVAVSEIGPASQTLYKRGFFRLLMSRP